MKVLATLGVLAAIAVGALAARATDLWGPDGSDPEVTNTSRPAPEATRASRPAPGPLQLGGPAATRGLEGSACERLAALATRLGRQTTDPTTFIRALGRAAAGIHTDSRALLDLARGGRDVLIGGGFRSAFSDGTPGQARHFAGIAVAASYGGGDSTRALSISARRDPPNSADGRLTDEAIAFEGALRRGELTTDVAGDWILARICRRSDP